MARGRRFKAALAAAAVLAGGATFVAFGQRGDESDGDATAAGRTSDAQGTAKFADAHESPPPGWTGPVFRLSQAYPATMPALGSAPWLQIDFRTQPNRYLRAILAYALQGNVAVSFRGQDNAVRKWYHAPWLHAGPRGREFIHGLTHERRSRPGELAATQTQPADNWAVGMYNPRAAFVIGQVWKNHDNPDPTKAKFPVGAVGFKLLFTSASTAQVPLLARSLSWQADVNRAPGAGPRPRVRLLQIDVAARDSRADSTTGWVFGTFVYNGKAAGQTVWDRMVPVGAMWGNDPARIANGGPLVQTAINPAARPLVRHLGFRGRLNGPVDNPVSSCLSCHSTAEVPKDLSAPATPVLPPSNSPAVIARYFRNVKAQTPFTAGRFSLDYSLQLQNGIANWARDPDTRFAELADGTTRVVKPSGKVRFGPAPR